MEKISLKTETAKYKIIVGNNLVEKEIIKFIQKKDYKTVLVVTEENVFSNYSLMINNLCKDINANIFVSKTGEKAKSFSNLQLLLSFFSKNNAKRNSLAIAIGGGVIGDLTGFASSIYMRGIDFIQIPTTLLSMVDSSVGGKTGINFKGLKNNIGSFYQPKRVIIDTDFLITLSKSEIVSGFGEILKCAFLDDEQFNAFIMSHYNEIIQLKSDYLMKAIIKSIKIKKYAVENDEKETNGLRKSLNLGHTFGHALESFLKFKLPHGICVIYGLYYVLFVAWQQNEISETIYNKYSEIIGIILQDYKINKLSWEQLSQYMQKDKKNKTSNEISFVLYKDFSNLELDYKIDFNTNIKILKNFCVFLLKNHYIIS